VLFPIVGEGLVERRVLVLGDIIGLAHPDGLGLIESFVLVRNLLDLLLILGLLLLILDLRLVVLLVLILLVSLFVIRLSDILVS
jgi:hypothetical protein